MAVAEDGTERLHQYWVHGEGAAKIAWGAPGDFGRCVAELGKYIGDPQGYCNLAHHAALGIWPATHAKEISGRAAMSTDTMRAQMATASINDLPDSAFAYIEPGGSRQAAKKHGVDVGDGGSGSRIESGQDGMMIRRGDYMRMYPLESIEILRSESGPDGVVVEAYAAVFDQPAEIVDGEGHYVEEIDRAAFDTAIEFATRNTGGLAGNVKVLYNHGMSAQGTPAPEFQLPLGVPIEIRPEQRGLLTRTRYDAGDPFTDRVLSKIRQGSITAQSFTGRIIRSDPQLRRGERHRPDRTGSLRTVRRTKLGLREYGPVLWPAYSGAEILGVRMSIPGGVPDPDEYDAQALLPDEGPASAGTDPLADEHSARYHQHALYALRSRELREQAGLVW